MPIVLVYLGNRLPVYAMLNLRYLLRTFPEHPVWLVTDNGKAAAIARFVGAKVFRCRSVHEAWESVRLRLPQRMDFRRGFWFLSFARFYALCEFMDVVDPGEILHVEADVWLEPDFPFHLVPGADAEVAFPLESEHGGVASTLWIRDAEAAGRLVRQAEAWASTGEVTSDMNFLAKLWSEGSMRVRILPSAPSGDAWLTQPASPATAEAMSGHAMDTGLFDGMAWGMDLLGEDPRNHWGVLRLFREHEQGAVRTGHAELSLDAYGHLEISNAAADRRVRIHSLHVHSKDVWMFLFPRWRLRRRLALRATGKDHSRWLPHVTIRVLWSLAIPWLVRRLKGS